jgi:hypothetical protein
MSLVAGTLNLGSIYVLLVSTMRQRLVQRSLLLFEILAYEYVNLWLLLSRVITRNLQL